MAGIMLGAAAGIQDRRMTVGSRTRTVGPDTFYYDGFAGGGTALSLVGGTALGSMTPVSLNGTTILGLYWAGALGHTDPAGNALVEVSGNQADGFITDIRCDEISLGALSGRNFNGTTTSWQLGGSRSNPFGTSGSRKIDVT